jgi:hypothetical protein
VIALGFAGSWLLIGIACAVLWVLWAVMDITAEMCQRWLEGRRKPRKEKGSSTSS